MQSQSPCARASSARCSPAEHRRGGVAERRRSGERLDRLRFERLRGSQRRQRGTCRSISRPRRLRMRTTRILTCLQVHEHHRALETALANLKGSEEAPLFPTDYAANLNLAVLTALADAPDCAIFATHSHSITPQSLMAQGLPLEVHKSHNIFPICHTPSFPFITRHFLSLFFASRGASPSLVIYRHNDMGHLDECLLASRAPGELIVSDSLFSMDGNCTHVRELTRLAKTHGAVLLEDEAHATLVFGSRGGGLAVGLDIDLHVGTLSKAFDTHGGFVAFTAKLKGLLLAGARTAIYSTLCPCRSSWLRRWPCALQRIGCTRLWANVAASWAATGIKPASPIMPIVVGSEANALAMSAALLCDGFLVPAIIPLLCRGALRGLGSRSLRRTRWSKSTLWPPRSNAAARSRWPAERRRWRRGRRPHLANQ